jgi:hypothetical protein
MNITKIILFSNGFELNFNREAELLEPEFFQNNKRVKLFSHKTVINSTCEKPIFSNNF